METILSGKKENLDPDAKEILECINHLDFRGACYAVPCEDEGNKILKGAQRAIERNLRDLADLVREIKKDGFCIHVLRKKFNEEDLTPGSIEIAISKKGRYSIIYRQVFGASFLVFFRDEYPNKESLLAAIERAKAEIETNQNAQEK